MGVGHSPGLVRSYSVLADEDQSRTATLDTARAALELLDGGRLLQEADIDVRGDERGAGYGIPTAAMIGAVRLMASSEGLLLDPVYSGKALAGLLRAARLREFRADANILFLMTGGRPGLFAYRKTLDAASGGGEPPARRHDVPPEKRKNYDCARAWNKWEPFDAFASLHAAVRAGAYQSGDSVLLVMTGGSPGIFAYRRAFDGHH
ncbi:pyridoxal-phosphate dependent enzyme [Bradyrhizobium sp. AZCC 2230]|uniref:pyridoxal-phosphate dependent enzyme n=1 Tax=Bradyrhizobium sp. AZCC 2230 TaxID=3117021 RepID=UPI002FF420C9